MIVVTVTIVMVVVPVAVIVTMVIWVVRIRPIIRMTIAETEVEHRGCHHYGRRGVDRRWLDVSLSWRLDVYRRRRRDEYRRRRKGDANAKTHTGLRSRYGPE
jgi:hypothetical protein